MSDSIHEDLHHSIAVRLAVTTAIQGATARARQAQAASATVLSNSMALVLETRKRRADQHELLDEVKRTAAERLWRSSSRT